MPKDLLQIPLLGSVLKSHWFWSTCRVLLLALMLLMIAYGWHHHAIPGVKTPDPLMYTNLANYGLWVLWLMGVVPLALLFGRIWCSFCPVGWLNGIVASFGLKHRLPGWLNSWLPVTLVLIALQLAVYLLALHRYPDFTAILLSLTLGLAVFCGLVFRARAFCQLFCPAGAVLSLYGRVAPFQLRVRRREQCAGCSSQRCVSGEHYWQRFSLGRGILYWHSQRQPCPVDLLPEQIDDAAGCTLCLHCLHNCEHDNLQLGFRPWLAELGKCGGLRGGETLFFVVLLGMLTANFSKVNLPLRDLLFWLPQQTALLLGWQAPGYSLLAAIWVCLLLPLLLLVPGLLIFRLTDLRRDIQPATADRQALVPELSTPRKPLPNWSLLGRLALPLIPLLLSSHLILALVKLNAKGGYLPFILQDPAGVQSYLAFTVLNTLAQPTALLSIELLKWLVLAIWLCGVLLSLWAARKIAQQMSNGRTGFFLIAAVVNICLCGGLYLDTIIRWLFLR